MAAVSAGRPLAESHARGRPLAEGSARARSTPGPELCNRGLSRLPAARTVPLVCDPGGATSGDSAVQQVATAC